MDVIAGARAQGRQALDELAGKKLLASFGVAVPKSAIVKDAKAAAAAVAQLRPPFALKIMSPDILHKSDAGGVKTGLKSGAEVEQAIAAMGALPAIKSARIEGFLVEEMAPAGQEIVVGGVRDPD